MKTFEKYIDSLLGENADAKTWQEVHDGLCMIQAVCMDYHLDINEYLRALVSEAIANEGEMIELESLKEDSTKLDNRVDELVTTYKMTVKGQGVLHLDTETP